MAQKPADIVGQVLRYLEEDEKAHKVFADKADKRYRAYRGILEKRSKPEGWTNKQHPAYVFQAIETVVGGLTNTVPRAKVTPIPVMDPNVMQQRTAGAKANELLLNQQLDRDHYAESQRTFALQALITGLSVRKQLWDYRVGERRFLQPQPGFGGIQLAEARQKQVLRDDPTSRVVDVRDFIWHEGAIDLKSCQRVCHRVWYSLEDLQALTAQGVYGPEAGGQSLAGLSDSQDMSGGLYKRENDLFEVNRAKDQVEVLEFWIEGGQRVVSVANRKVLLADRENPFWLDHLEHPYPFVVCSGAPDLFRIPGISDVELMAELQEMLWTLVNQRLDSLQLLSNAIFLIADDVEDPEEFEIGPGERWLVPRPVSETVKPWSPDPNVPKMTLEAEALLKGDLQNVTGGSPFLSGTDTQGVDQATATGVSIITTLAQRRLASKKQQFVWADQRVLEQWMALNQQFVRSPRLVAKLGLDGERAFDSIRPEMLQGDYAVDLEAADESMIRQERRGEAQGRLMVFLQAAPIYAAMRQPLNGKAFMDDYLEAFNVVNKDRYYSAVPQQLPQPQQQQPGPPGAPPMGITSPLAAGPTSPSNGVSISPEQFAQRFLASRGGVANG